MHPSQIKILVFDWIISDLQRAKLNETQESQLSLKFSSFLHKKLPYNTDYYCIVKSSGTGKDTYHLNVGATGNRMHKETFFMLAIYEKKDTLPNYY